MTLSIEEQRVIDGIAADVQNAANRLDAIEIHLGLKEAPPEPPAPEPVAQGAVDEETKTLLQKLLAKLG